MNVYVIYILAAVVGCIIGFIVGKHIQSAKDKLFMLSRIVGEFYNAEADEQAAIGIQFNNNIVNHRDSGFIILMNQNAKTDDL